MATNAWNTIVWPALLLALGLVIMLAGPGALPAQAAAAPPEQTFREAISDVESSEGAYAPALSEQLLSLGLSLQQQQRHREAAKVFRRGVHLARINNGLYCAEQIPLLQGEISSYMALGAYAEVDDRENYLYRLQLRRLDTGMARAAALMQQADWEYQAYQLGRQWQLYDRLSKMWELYRLALVDITDTVGNSSPELMAPLTGLLRTQYLISSYRFKPEDSSSGTSSGNTVRFGSSTGNHSQLGPSEGFGYGSQNYKNGQTIIKAMHDIERARYGEDSAEVATTIVMLGDWAQWYGKNEESSKFYRHALAELATLDDAQQQTGLLFSTPVALPNVGGIGTLPQEMSAKQGNILLEFGVDSRGRVVDLVRLDKVEERDAEAHRLMRELRKTKFRPRFDGGEPVATDKVVRAYETKQ